MCGGQGWTRRAILSSFTALSVSAAASDKDRTFPSERVRYLDPATEFPVFRLTDPAHSSELPAYTCRAVSRRNAFLLYSSDRTGSPQAFRMDLRTGQSVQLTEARDLDRSSLSLLPDDGGFCYIDGGALRVVSFRRMKEKEVYRLAGGAKNGPGVNISQEGGYALLTAVHDGGSQLMLAPLSRGTARVVATSSGTLAYPIASPRGDAVLYRDGASSLRVVRTDGRDNRSLLVASGRVGAAYWSPEGDSALYLSLPAERGRLNSIRQTSISSAEDRQIAATSQFAQFAANEDASVFAGASGSLASPYLLILLRRTGREVTLCEHRASDAVRTAPVFSYDSQRIFFQSDRHGRPAIYYIPVERMVERTPDV